MENTEIIKKRKELFDHLRIIEGTLTKLIGMIDKYSSTGRTTTNTPANPEEKIIQEITATKEKLDNMKSTIHSLLSIEPSESERDSISKYYVCLIIFLLLILIPCIYFKYNIYEEFPFFLLSIALVIGSTCAITVSKAWRKIKVKEFSSTHLFICLVKGFIIGTFIIVLSEFIGKIIGDSSRIFYLKLVIQLLVSWMLALLV